jgi:hypothetical protein
MSTRFVNKRRPASPLAVPTAQIAATTSTVIAIDNSTTPERSTRVEGQAPRCPRSKPIPIPASPHGGVNPRANEHRIEAFYAKRRLMDLNAHRTTSNAVANKHALTHRNLDAQNSLTTYKGITSPNNSRAAGTTSRNPTTSALLSGLTPLTQIHPTTATAPTTHTPPETDSPRQSDNWNGYTPVVYGGGRPTAWVRAHPPAVEQEAASKPDPTPAQRSLTTLRASHDRAVTCILAARAAAEEVDRSKAIKEKRDALMEEEAEVEREEKVEAEPRDPGLGRPEEHGACVCLKQAGYWSEVKCGRYCEMV